MAYLEKLPSAVSGSGGHNATLRTACECFRFGLSTAEAWDALQWFNANRCSPIWNEKDLRHKLEDAERITIRAGEKGKRVVNRRALHIFIAPDVPKKITSPVMPVCQRSVQAEEIWWSRVAIERGTTLEAWDTEKR
mgnify:CR=1 FL=1